MLQGPNLQGLSHQAREARSWPFEQARLLLDRITRLRLGDAERDLAATLFAQGKFAEAVQTLPALAKPVVFQCGYGASGLPHLGTFGEATRPTIVRNAFRALTEDAIATTLIATVPRRNTRAGSDRTDRIGRPPVRAEAVTTAS